MCPNGFASQEERLKFINRLDREFSSYKDLIELFAKKYNLRIEKYFHDFPSWDLTFQRKDGVYGRIEILFRTEQNDGFDLYLILWQDDFESTTRKLREIHRGTFFNTQPKNQLENELEKIIEEIKKIQINNLDKVYGPYKEWKKTWKNNAEFLKASQIYPIIKI